MHIKVSNTELLKIWDKLEEIFYDYTGFDKRFVYSLQSIGWYAEINGKHCKIYMNVGDNKKTMIISSTPSDRHAGRQILRQIRRMYE